MVLGNLSIFNTFGKNNLRSLSSYPDAMPTTHATPMFHENLIEYRQHVEDNDALYSLSFVSKPMRAKSIERFFKKPFIWPKRLSIISFEGCKMKDEGLIELCKHMIHAPRSLTLLNLSENGITSKHIDTFAKAISQTNINKINLNHNDIDILSLNAALKKHCEQGHTIVLWSAQGRQLIAPSHQDEVDNEDAVAFNV